MSSLTYNALLKKLARLDFAAQQIFANTDGDERTWIELLARPDLGNPAGASGSVEHFMLDAYATLGPVTTDLKVLSRAFERLDEVSFFDSHDAGIVSFNIHPRSIHLDSFAEKVLYLCADYNFDPQRLCLEILEYCGPRKISTPLAGLTKLRAAGVSFALDDVVSFATHTPASMPYHLDFLKLDKSVLWLDRDDGRFFRLVSDLQVLCRFIKAELVIEGVETIDHMRSIADLGIDWLQGHLFSLPQPLEDISVETEYKLAL